MKKYLVKFYIIACFMLSSFSLFAQPGDTDGTPTDNLEGTDPAASINSYLLILALVGVFYVSINLKALTLNSIKRRR